MIKTLLGFGLGCAIQNKKSRKYLIEQGKIGLDFLGGTIKNTVKTKIKGNEKND